MPSSAKKPEAPKPTRSRKPSTVVVRCEIANCDFTAKTTKTVQKHREKVHEMEPVNDSVLDQSVSCSILDDTVPQGDSGEADSMEHKTSTDFYQEVSNVKQSTQLASTGKRGRNSDTEDEEEDKRRKLSLTAPDMTMSQGEIERQEVRARAMATVERGDLGDPLNTSRSLLEGDSERPEASEDIFQDSSLLLKTAHETINSASSDSLSLTSFTISGEDNEIKCLENKLTITEDSLKQALARIATLETNESVKIAKIEALENKLSKKDKELKDTHETIKVMTDDVDKKADPKAAKKNVSLTTKVAALEKKLAEAKAEATRAKENAEAQCTITEGFKMVQADLTSQVKALKRETLCKDSNCTNPKECGRSHTHKEERE